MHWLDDTPQVVFHAAIEKMPQLEAEESMLTANRTAIGTGSVEADAARRMTAAWERAANGGRRPLVAKATPEMLRSMGIGLHVGTR